ncbi:hypothetical protein BX611_0064 [Lutibacter oceani]|uniref:DUF4136 domain-containing protein n=1 Tax=Lutibacter oceani TaxID=1853311 RepID=A0A3D9RZ11_9FLAO|nr:hypothetical protein [Lutibacter oceani]REE82794.1 hypothetical protein BX611_0064 [Lutibacter oceani]
MRKIIIIVFLVLISCSTTRFVDSWRNPEITTFKPEKVLIIGMTDNLTARKIFEEDLKNAFVQRNINAIESNTVLDDTFTSSKKSEAEIDEMINEISKEGFDAVVITAVKGVDEKISYDDGYYTVGYRWSRFGRYYYRYQDIYYTPRYYDTYNVYHVETSIYNLNGAENKLLVWVGALDLVNPQKITSTVKDYVDSIIEQLEMENLIKKY